MSTQRLFQAATLGAGRAYPDPIYFPSTIEASGRTVLRVLVQTHLILPGDDIRDLMAWYLKCKVQPGDVVFIGQKAAAVAEGR